MQLPPRGWGGVSVVKLSPHLPAPMTPPLPLMNAGPVFLTAPFPSLPPSPYQQTLSCAFLMLKLSQRVTLTASSAGTLSRLAELFRPTGEMSVSHG